MCTSSGPVRGDRRVVPEADLLGDRDLAGVTASDLDVAYMSIHDESPQRSVDGVALGATLQRPDIDRAAGQRGWGHGPGECRHGCLQARGQGHDAPPLAWMSVRPGQVPCPHVTIY